MTTTTTTEPEIHGGVSNYNYSHVEWRRFHVQPEGETWTGRMRGIFSLHASTKWGTSLFLWSVWVHGTCLGRGETEDLNGAKLYAELCADRRETEIWQAIRSLDIRVSK